MARNCQGGSSETAPPYGPHAEELRGSGAPRSMLHLSAPAVGAGTSFEAASRRLRTRSLGVTMARKWRRKPLKSLKTGSEMATRQFAVAAKQN
jgi:hypothetical protein